MSFYPYKSFRLAPICKADAERGNNHIWQRSPLPAVSPPNKQSAITRGYLFSCASPVDPGEKKRCSGLINHFILCWSKQEEPQGVVFAQEVLQG